MMTEDREVASTFQSIIVVVVAVVLPFSKSESLLHCRSRHQIQIPFPESHAAHTARFLVPPESTA